MILLAFAVLVLAGILRFHLPVDVTASVRVLLRMIYDSQGSKCPTRHKWFHSMALKYVYIHQTADQPPGK